MSVGEITPKKQLFTRPTDFFDSLNGVSFCLRHSNYLRKGDKRIYRNKVYPNLYG